MIEREAPGLAEAMRLCSPLGRLSRGVVGIRGRAIIANTPGSTKGCIEQLDAVLDVLPARPAPPPRRRHQPLTRPSRSFLVCDKKTAERSSEILSQTWILGP